MCTFYSVILDPTLAVLFFVLHRKCLPIKLTWEENIWHNMVKQNLVFYSDMPKKSSTPTQIVHIGNIFIIYENWSSGHVAVSPGVQTHWIHTPRVSPWHRLYRKKICLTFSIFYQYYYYSYFKILHKPTTTELFLWVPAANARGELSDCDLT